MGIKKEKNDFNGDIQTDKRQKMGVTCYILEKKAYFFHYIFGGYKIILNFANYNKSIIINLIN